MNIEQAKSIPLALILEKIGCMPVSDKKHQSKYLSPLRNEKTPSFFIHHQKNAWYDFGIGKGGNSLAFVCAWLESTNESSTVRDALRWLNNMAIYVPTLRSVERPVPIKKAAILDLKEVKPLQHPALLKYLARRAIPVEFASPYVVEVRLHNREKDKEFFALGFANEEEGYEIRNPFFKGCIGTKAISFIRGKQPKANGIHIFEGFLDYVSAITFQGVTQFDDDTIVLNSLSCLKQATPYIKNYGYHMAYTWLDNDPAGHQATQTLSDFFETESHLQHKPMNDLYHPHKDVNAALMHRQGLTP